jgi:hypothetical protein
LGREVGYYFAGGVDLKDITDINQAIVASGTIMRGYGPRFINLTARKVAYRRAGCNQQMIPSAGAGDVVVL